MDITERKRAEKALMKIDSKTKAMLEALEYQVTTTLLFRYQFETSAHF